ncbi:MAG: hypothetical protein LQ347_006953 [Umbilicaria vellea]|nr:MAG: hypothetical protein LQ347_006953 [Umbilicaria vellea]
MAIPQKLQDIQEGVYLSDVLSAVSLKSSPFHHEAADRPFAIPCYDPEGSTTICNDPPPPPYNRKALPRLPPRAACRAPAARKQGDALHSDSIAAAKYEHAAHAPRLELYRSRNRRSRLSITPSAVPLGAESQPLSSAQTTELARLTRHAGGGRAISGAKSAEAAVPEPPDGGTLAWLHVAAGHLVVFNAQ